ncbi:hypothetical protein [Vibrio maritimus]|uniref:hypothetical protein n=1 Tax=Vibrio maritimus TaxID=990268 RepID=UPI001F17978B|nr:hypothetical protein [Vibrio maritimus]
MNYSKVAASVVLTLAMTGMATASESTINITGDNSSGATSQSTLASSEASIVINASESSSVISQTGDDSAVAKIKQYGDDSTASITQTQESSAPNYLKKRKAFIDQTALAGNNDAIIVQETAAGEASIKQRDSTTNALAEIYTSGAGSSNMTIDQASVTGESKAKILNVSDKTYANQNRDTATINQVRGSNLDASIAQTGNENKSKIQQGYVNGLELTDSKATINVVGDKNELSIEQKFGANNMALAEAFGDENTIDTLQHGSQNSLTIDVTGNGNSAGDADFMISQVGSFNSVNASIWGDNNVSVISQVGDNHIANSMIIGSGNTSTITQQ